MLEYPNIHIFRHADLWILQVCNCEFWSAKCPQSSVDQEGEVFQEDFMLTSQESSPGDDFTEFCLFIIHSNIL